MSITLNDMRDSLLTLDKVGEILAETEPFSQERITSDSAIHFTYPDGWNADLETVGGTETVAATMRINGTEHAMTKDAALLAAAQVGLTGAYLRKTPGPLIASHLNYWYSAGMGETEYNVLSVGDNISAFVKPTIVPFSNLALFEAAVDGIKSRYGSDTEILADYKIHNSLLRTDLRLIVPEDQRTVTGGGLTDVPSGEADLWSAGVHLSNSLTGKTPTSVDAYLFRWWCTNGATTTMADVGTWSRRGHGQSDEVYIWAQEAVDEVLGGMEHRFNEVQALTSVNLAGNVADILREIYEQYEVPVSQRRDITDALLESETLTMYSVMNAITSLANNPDLNPERADRLMRIGGSLPRATFDTVKAQVWNEGHTADPTQTNPYAIGV